MIRDLEVTDEGPEDGVERAGRVEGELNVPETMPLLRVVVYGAVRRRRRDAEAILHVVGGHEVAEGVQRSAVLSTRLEPGLTAAIYTDVTAWLERAAFGLDVEDARCPQPVLGRQGTSQERDGFGEPRAQPATLTEQRGARRSTWVSALFAPPGWSWIALSVISYVGMPMARGVVRTRASSRRGAVTTIGLSRGCEARMRSTLQPSSSETIPV